MFVSRKKYDALEKNFKALQKNAEDILNSSYSLKMDKAQAVARSKEILAENLELRDKLKASQAAVKIRSDIIFKEQKKNMDLKLFAQNNLPWLFKDPELTPFQKTRNNINCFWVVGFINVSGQEHYISRTISWSKSGAISNFLSEYTGRLKNWRYHKRKGLFIKRVCIVGVE